MEWLLGAILGVIIFAEADQRRSAKHQEKMAWLRHGEMARRLDALLEIARRPEIERRERKYKKDINKLNEKLMEEIAGQEVVP
jgi:hypothetical protein